MPPPTYNYLPLQQFVKNTTYTVQNAGDECGHGYYGNVVHLVKKDTSYKPKKDTFMGHQQVPYIVMWRTQVTCMKMGGSECWTRTRPTGC